MEQDNTNSKATDEAVQRNAELNQEQSVKRGRGRPKGSKNKPKNEAVASDSTLPQPTKSTALEDKMVADGMDRAAAAKANDEVHELLRKMFNVSDTHYDTEDVNEYGRRLNEMTKVQIQAEVAKRGRNALHDTDRNIKILIDLFKEYWANRKASQVPVREIKMTPEVEKILKEWHGKTI